jgi:hypothetical protein
MPFDHTHPTPCHLDAEREICFFLTPGRRQIPLRCASRNDKSSEIDYESLGSVRTLCMARLEAMPEQEWKSERE